LINIFNSFDEDGTGSILALNLKAGLACLCEGTLEERLKLAYFAFDGDKSGYLEPDEIISMVTMIEK
jgi:Ca2+-binding EF-hand superfamily protein